MALILLVAVPSSFAQVDDATRQLSHDIFKELIEINTTDSVGSVTASAEAMAKGLRAAGFAQDDVQTLGPNEREKNALLTRALGFPILTVYTIFTNAGCLVRSIA